MKKSKTNILIYILMYLIIYIILFYILKLFKLTFVGWIKNLSIIIVSIGIIAGIIQIVSNIDKNKKIIKFILYVFTVILAFIILIINFIYFIFISNTEEYSKYEGKNMIKETREVLKSNYIKYYDYTNPFIRSTQERVYVGYDDCISQNEYAGTYYYNKDGEMVEDFKGTKYIDLSDLKKYENGGNATYQNVQELINDVYKNYEKNIYKVESSDKCLLIYLTNIEEKLILDEQAKQKLNDSIQTFLLNESLKKDMNYSIKFLNGYIAIYY